MHCMAEWTEGIICNWVWEAKQVIEHFMSEMGMVSSFILAICSQDNELQNLRIMQNRPYKVPRLCKKIKCELHSRHRRLPAVTLDRVSTIQ